MNFAQSLALTTCLVAFAPPLAAQAIEDAPPSGPIAAAARRESTRLASAAQDRADDPDWLRVQQLPQGTEIVVTVRGAAPEKRLFSSADADNLISAIPNGPTSTIARADVAEIRGPVRTRGWLGGLVGAAIGGAVGFTVGASVVHNSGREAYGPLFWGPLAGGVAGGLVGSHMLPYATREVLYRRRS